MYQKISPEDQQIFGFNLAKLDWRDFIFCFAIGWFKFLTDGDPDINFKKMDYVLSLRKEPFNDYNWAFYHGK